MAESVLEGPFARFNLLLAEASVVSDAADAFDLHRDAPASVAAFNKLGARYRDVAVELIELCAAHRAELLAALKAMK